MRDADRGQAVTRDAQGRFAKARTLDEEIDGYFDHLIVELADRARAEKKRRRVLDQAVRNVTASECESIGMGWYVKKYRTNIARNIERGVLAYAAEIRLVGRIHAEFARLWAVAAAEKRA